MDPVTVATLAPPVPAPPDRSPADLSPAGPDPDADVLAVVVRLVREVVGEAWIEELEIGRETSFGRDLELESIEFVALAERLQEVWGARVDFVGWLASMELEALIELTVGELVEHVESCLRS